MNLNEDNFPFFARSSYSNKTCLTEEEYEEDLKKIKQIMRLFNKYEKTGNININLTLNHFILLFNVFDHKNLIQMLYYKIPESQWCILKPFLLYLNYIKECDYDKTHIDLYITKKLQLL